MIFQDLAPNFRINALRNFKPNLLDLYRTLTILGPVFTPGHTHLGAKYGPGHTHMGLYDSSSYGVVGQDRFRMNTRLKCTGSNPTAAPTGARHSAGLFELYCLIRRSLRRNILYAALSTSNPTLKPFLNSLAMDQPPNAEAVCPLCDKVPE